MRRKVLSLIIYAFCLATAVLFLTGLLTCFPAIAMDGFDLSEYWLLTVFGIPLSLVAAVLSLVRGMKAAMVIVKGIGEPASDEDDEESADDTERKPASSRAQEGKADNAKEIETSAASQKEARVGRKPDGKKLTRAERRREKLLRADDEKKKSGSGGLVFAAIMAVFCMIYGVWVFCPHRLAFHNYVHTDASYKLEEGEIRNFRFYQSYLGKPYFIYHDEKSNKDFDVGLAGKKRGSDELGEYIDYFFRSEVQYAKLLDCAMKRYSDIKIEVNVRYYEADAHIVVDSYFQKIYNGNEEHGNSYERRFNGKVYAYREIIS